MSAFLDGDSVDRSNRMAAIRWRKRQGKAPDPNVGSHLPPAPNQSQAKPPNATDVSGNGIKHGRRASIQTPERSPPGAQGKIPSPPRSPPRGILRGRSTDQQGNGEKQDHQVSPQSARVQYNTAPPGISQPGPLAQNRIYLGPGTMPSPRVEMQPLGLTQIFSSKLGNRDGSQTGSSARTSLISEIVSEGKEPTTKPSADLVRCADYVATQPDSLDAFLRKYASSGGTHVPTPRGGPGHPYPLSEAAIGPTQYPTMPPLRVSGMVQELPSNEPSPTAAQGKPHGGIALAAFSNLPKASPTSVPSGTQLPVGSPTLPSDDPSHMLLAESTFVRPKHRAR